MFGGKFFTALLSGIVAGGIGVVTGGVGAGLFLGGLAFLSSYFYPTPKMNYKMKPAPATEISITQAQEGAPIPIVYGQVKIPGTIIWYGNLWSKEVVEEVSGGGKGGGKKKQKVHKGYIYYFDMWQVICQGKVQVRKLFRNETQINGILPTGGIYTDEGGNYGYVIFNTGADFYHPTINDTGVASVCWSKLPGVAHIFFKNFKIGMNTTVVPTITFEVRRILENIPFDTEVCEYGDCGYFYLGNTPSAVIYDLLVNQIGYDPSLINVQSFAEATEYYKEKKWGINLAITETENVWSIIDRILKAVDSFLYLDENGRLALKVLKDDDEPVATIQDDFISFELTKKSITEVPNVFKANILYSGKIQTVALENPVLLDKTGIYNLQTVDLTMFSNRKVALERLNDLLRRYSYPYATLRITVPAKYSYLEVGDVVNVVNTEAGLSGQFRIVDINEEDIDKNQVSMMLIQHTGHLVEKTYEPPEIVETPSRIEANLEPLTEVRILELDEIEGFLLLVPKKTGTETGYNVYLSKDNVNYSLADTLYTFVDLYELIEDYPADTYDIDDEVGIKVRRVRTYKENEIMTNYTRAELFERNRFLVVDNEIMKFQTVIPLSDDEFLLKGVIRGWHFTKKQYHSQGSLVYIGVLGDNLLEMAISSSYYFKVVPFNHFDSLELSEVSPIHVSCQLKYYKPQGIQRVYVKVETNRLKVDVFPKTKQTVSGAGMLSPEIYSDSYPVSCEGKLMLSINGLDYQTYDSYNIEIGNNSYPVTLKMKQRLNQFDSEEVELFIPEEGEYVISVDENS